MSDKKRYNRLRKKIIEFEKSNNYFLTLLNRPKQEKNLGQALTLDKTENVGIVLQGPIVYQEDFTVETCNLYVKNFPNSKVILSTWDNENYNYLKRKLGKNVILLLNKLPSNPGHHNLLYQSHSSYKGIEEAETLGCKYALKTRTDQRIYNNNALYFMSSLMEKYPIKSGKQKNRILLIDQVSKKYIPYFFSDLLQYGTVVDLKKYWSIDNDDREITSDNLKENKISDVSYRSNSCHIAKNYIRKTFGKLEYTVQHSWKVLNDYFYIMSKNDLDLYWYQDNPSIDAQSLAYKKEDPKRYLDRSFQRLQEYREKNYGDKYLLDCFSQVDWVIMNTKGVEHVLPPFEYTDIKNLERLHSFKKY